MVNSILSILAAIIPFIIELIQKKRDDSQTPMGYVKAQQDAKLATVEAMLEKDGGNLSRIRTLQLQLTAELLRRVRDARSKPSQ